MGFSVALPFREVTLTRFGGLYTEADARDLPMGASPLNWDVDYLIGSVGVRPGLLRALTTGAPGNSSFQFLKSVLLPSGEITLTQGSDGLLRQEQLSTPGSLTSIYAGILNNARALSETFGNKEFIGLSNLIQGSDQPRTWDGSNIDRVSQTAPQSSVFSVTAGGAGATLAAGTRYAVILFQMRNGYITAASMPVSFTTTAANSTLTFNAIPTGPGAAGGLIVARIIAVTAANAGIGGPYYWVAGPGSQATIINDNTTTSFTATVSDVQITGGINIAAPGNNLLSGHQREVGEFVKAVQYVGRAFYLGERVKIDNLRNMTFDGGIDTGGVPAGWTLTGSPGLSLISSQIYGSALAWLNSSGSTLVNPLGTPTVYISQSLATDAFNAPITLTGVLYSMHVTAYCTAGAVGTAVLSAELDGGPNGNPAHSTSLLTTTPTEYVINLTAAGGAFTTLKVYPSNLPNNQSVFIDRMELFPISPQVFPITQPVYASQLNGSYFQNYQAVDTQTCALDTSGFEPNPQTNAFRFLDTLYITTKGRTYKTPGGSGEPATWVVSEVSNSVGCLGPLAEDVGEEYVAVADRRGVYVFDGGNHKKISQEIQQVWEQIYWPSASQVWIKNDVHQKRILVGVPMVTPNAYLPNAPVNATPATPNVILMCSYLGLDSGAALADAAGVHVSSFTGMLLARDLSRKWTIWNIASPMGNFIDRADGSEQLWLGGSGTGQIYQLTPTVFTDDGAAINETYYTYGFADEQTAEAKQLGTVRRLFAYMTGSMDGVGGMIPTLYPNSPASQFVDAQPVVTLTFPEPIDVNIPINETGGRMFIKFATDGIAGDYFTLHRVVVGSMEDPRIPVSGA